MTKQFYKSLDKEMEIFGIKGKWIKYVLILAGCSVGLGVVIGFCTSSLIGFISVMTLIVVSVFAVIFLQPKCPSRRIDKAKLADKCRCWVVRRETLSRIILEDPMYYRVKEEIKAAKAGGN